MPPVPDGRFDPLPRRVPPRSVSMGEDTRETDGPTMPEFPLSFDWVPSEETPSFRSLDARSGDAPADPLPDWSPRPDRTQHLPTHVPPTPPALGTGGPGHPGPPPTDGRAGPAVPPPRGRPGRSSRTLTSRAVLVTCLAALISVLVTAVVAFPLAIRESNSAARRVLADKASIAAQAVEPRANGTVGVRAAQAVRLLRKQGVDAYLIHNGQVTPTGLPARFVTQIAGGDDVTGATALIGGHRVLVEGRAVTNGNGIVLITTASSALTGNVALRLLFALLAGLLAGALAGTLLARRLARPIRNAADAAARLSAGDRSVRLRPEPPAEAEDLAHALNELAAALTASEGRQRDFLLSISHELRTPLTSLKGYAEALADGVVGPDGAQRAGETMLVEAGNLERLVTDLLSLARLEAADFPLESVPVELTNLVNTVVEAWSGRWAAAGLVLRTELPSVPVIVYTDPGRIRQIVDGLLENALRVVPSGAPIVLSVRGPGPSAPGHGLIEVRDGGPGFTDADLAVVFERGALYERYRGIRQVGSGLGLALAAGLARRLGGFIQAGHAPEGGARFTVGLPTLAASRRR